MDITKVATWNNRVNEQEALKLTEEKGLTLLSSKELQEITKDDNLWKQYKDCFPCRSGTRISYKAGETKALIKHPGEKEKQINLPLNDGWYIVGEDGIPNGAKSNSSDKDAGHLWRYQHEDFTGLVARDCKYFGYGRRDVICIYEPTSRFGVLGRKGKLKVTKKGKQTKVQELLEKIGVAKQMQTDATEVTNSTLKECAEYLKTKGDD